MDAVPELLQVLIYALLTGVALAGLTMHLHLWRVGSRQP